MIIILQNAIWLDKLTLARIVNITQYSQIFDYQDWSMVEEYWVKHESEFSMDNKHGKGKLFLSNGEMFEGHFK